MNSEPMSGAEVRRFPEGVQGRGRNEVSKKQLKISTDSTLTMEEMKPDQHFTQPPARYTEASLVKTLEENGVGRPSTYAPTITTILARGYVGKEQKKLFPTELGEIVYTILEGYFEHIINVEFTASLEKRLDSVEEGSVPWKDVIRDFFPDFEKLVEKAEEEISKIEIKDEETDIICDLCGRNMVIKMGKFGKFLACPGFPECRNTKPSLRRSKTYPARIAAAISLSRRPKRAEGIMAVRTILNAIS